ncbi:MULTISPECIES: 2OG-Fe dioxygenase family protein [Streptomyces]|uniref:2OG-Fe dioxygenase family protein n=1 Tax=Streptomyces ramulosus TaxID=47762 RepID=A0ABW1FUR8_9ACTN
MNQQLTEDGLALLDGVLATDEQLASYEDCPHDPYMGNGTRYKRFSQYKIFRGGDGWETELLPARAYVTPKKFNPVGGGFRRLYSPLVADFTGLVKRLAGEIGLDPSTPWQINVHQNRSVAEVTRHGQLTPEGRHKDGHEYVSISVFRRHNVSGGHTRVWADKDSGEPLWERTLEPGQTVLLDDRAVFHDVTDIEPLTPEGGHRDILIIAYSRWDERWYGDAHDNEALDTEAPDGGADAT